MWSLGDQTSGIFSVFSKNSIPCFIPSPGSTCSIDESKSACTPTPCLAGGTCAPLPESNFACLCPDGRSGMTCEHGK